jgi:choline dehydrogenase-like flavoprotein
MTKVKYDDIIGGGGSTGCVPADRLCADNPVLVLLSEAARSHRHPLISIPPGCGVTAHSPGLARD